ncbi:hypothetical protein BASA50_007062 [Batrachochytrium salamandrivorans]|uniref:RxLR effector protein n=1 Tax=Batrachochytrium salamandrivorans TaxID=1357716 RepID=A0ABQ8F820_9FUNG|nr:hypothetical protein BASA50_007062 [Batrachochytrium salamandrivorans]
MKLNALVVAAMVITSVNAGLPDKLPSEVENSGGRSMSVFSPDSSGNGLGPFQESEPTNKESADDSGGDGIGEDLASYPNGAHVEEKSGGISGGVDGYDQLGDHNKLNADERRVDDERRGDDERQDGHGGRGSDGGLGNLSDEVNFKKGPECNSLISELYRLWTRSININFDALSPAITLKGPSTKKKTFLGERVDKKSKLYIMAMDKLKVLKKSVRL